MNRQVSRGPARTAERSLAPDLARGAMLLLIALANSAGLFWSAAKPERSTHHPAADSLADQLTQIVLITTVDLRVYPMFAFLFGYGIVQLYRRQIDAGTSERDTRRLLRRRHWWMIAFGLLHALLLWEGDVLASYGLAALLLVWFFMRRRDRTLRIWIGVLTLIGLLSLAVMAMGAWFQAQGAAGSAEDMGLTSVPEFGYLDALVDRMIFWPALALFQGLFGLIVPIAILIGLLAARHRVLEQPERYRRLLLRTALIGIPMAWAGGAVAVLQHVGVLGIPPQSEWIMMFFQLATGLPGGLGYIAVFALLAPALQRRRSAAAAALAALGRCSLSGYLAQSVLIIPVMAPWGLGLGNRVSSWSMALYAVGVWLVTVMLAVMLDRQGRRGPAEYALRRLAYGRQPSVDVSRPSVPLNTTDVQATQVGRRV